ncbi:MAG: glycosyltransferase family 1 protein [bacterium]
MKNKKELITLFYRKKREGVNSIETVFDSLTSLSDHHRLSVPREGSSIKSILKNLSFAYKNKSKINHITGDIHYIALALGRNTVLTIHDVGSALNSKGLKRAMIRLLWFTIPALIVKKITVISQFTKDELIKIVPFAKNKIVVIHNSFNPITTFDKREFNNQQPVILHIGTKSNKNLERVIDAIAELKCALVILGKLSEQQKEKLSKSNIHYKALYDISYPKVMELYKECDIVSFPSLYEGFGLPVLEANAVGRVIIAGGIQALREVANDSAYFVDPYSVNSIRDGFKRVIEDENLRANLIDRGVVNIKRFSEQEISNKYNQLYQTL